MGKKKYRIVHISERTNFVTGQHPQDSSYPFYIEDRTDCLTLRLTNEATLLLYQMLGRSLSQHSKGYLNTFGSKAVIQTKDMKGGDKQ